MEKTLIILSVPKTGDGIFIDVAAGMILCCDLFLIGVLQVFIGTYRTFLAVKSGIERNNMAVDIWNVMV